MFFMSIQPYRTPKNAKINPKNGLKKCGNYQTECNSEFHCCIYFENLLPEKNDQEKENFLLTNPLRRGIIIKLS